VFARQPCDPIPHARDVGQWLCVPPFRVVCPFQASDCLFDYPEEQAVCRSGRNSFLWLKRFAISRI
jgi:hypothetical protein